MKLSFDELPQAVSEIFSKLSSIERLLQEKYDSEKSNEDQLLTIQQAAEVLDLAVPTIYGYVHRSEIPYSKIKKRLYFSKKEITDWIKTGRQKTVSEINASAEESLKPKRKRK